MLASSEAKLVGVHPDLVRVIREADLILPRLKSSLGFVVTEGLRSASRQRELVNAGASQTMNSRHLTGHAADLAATVGGDIRWDWSLYYVVGEAMRQASVSTGIPVVWGGVWDRKLSELTADGTQDDVEAYVTRRRNMGKKAFLDGPHFELDRARYP